MASALLAVLLATAGGFALPQQPQDPVIGIVVMPPVQGGACVTLQERWRRRLSDPTMPPSGNATGCVWSLYVRWLESSGARVVPFPWDANASAIDALLTRVNGVLLTGGILEAELPLYHKYYATVMYLYKSVVAMNARGDRMVLWGTCEGFQFISAAAAGTLAVIEGGFKGMDPRMLAVDFTSGSPASRLYGTAPPGVIAAMATRNTTLNWHHMGVTPEAFAAGGALSGKGLVPLATSADANGRLFVAALEHESAAVYAVQFHPERPPYEFTNDAIGHGPAAIVVSDYHSLFLTEQLRGNKHSFSGAVEVNSLAIANYPLYNEGYGIEVYFV